MRAGRRRSRDLKLILCFALRTEDPLVGAIAHEYLHDREKHDKTALEWTRCVLGLALAPLFIDFCAPCNEGRVHECSRDGSGRRYAQG